MFSSNPYRFLGVLSNSGIKNIQKNLSKIKAYSKIGKDISLPYELNFFNFKELNRSESLIIDAENKILLDPNKIKHSLFWFTDSNSIDKIALENLNKGNVEKSETIWRKVIKEKSISKNNLSAYNNLSTLLFLKSLSEKKNDNFKNSASSIKSIKEGIKLKAELIFSDYMLDFSKLICGNENALTREEILVFFNNTISSLFDDNFSIKEISKIINQSNKKLSESFNSLLIDEPFSNLNVVIDAADTNLSDNHSNGCLIGKKLIKDSISDLKLLKEVLGKDNLRYEMITDKLANQIMQCGILCFNKTNNDNDFLSSYKYALSISVKDSTIERAKTTIKHCEEQATLSICCNCKKNNVDFSKPIKTKMFKETERAWYSNQVKYNILTLTIYFCVDCNKKIENSSDSELYVSLGLTGIAIIIMLINEFGFLTVILAFPAFGLASFIGGLFNTIESDAINKQKSVKDSYNEGYSFSEPGN